MRKETVHVTHINFLPAPAGLSAAEVFEHWPSVVDIPEAAASSGIRVSVIQAARHKERLTRNGIEYHFMPVGRGKTLLDRGYHFADLLDHLRSNVLHVHGLGFGDQALAISHYLPRLPVLFQDHADRPPRWWRRSQWRAWYADAAGATFTSLELAKPFTAAGVFGAGTRLFAIPESSCRFTPGDRAQARSESGLYGDPCVVWVGHLSGGKDPLTVLSGVAQAAEQLPSLQLWCAFGSAPLLAQVQQRIEQDARLAGRVHLLGKVPHERIERLMQSADLFVSGSRAESCGYALLEAMACGACPVVTDIPSFRALTDGGRIGQLWSCANAASLADALVRAAGKRSSPAQVRAHFEQKLSFEALGRQWAEAYAQVLAGTGR
ncbi:glycosyltransferase family 4 protein [Dyella flagellata]|uniref:Glycosyl transferase n=1 Tax=Dyella flagellata TaxID=1867833 RepID=A0ABQ5X6W7_9GAMM|nr:glycosyltransferase family 4 protein [Dyella flagellata]GLQ86436.1 glycosyl transferase [Dyella flagellata]